MSGLFGAIPRRIIHSDPAIREWATERTIAVTSRMIVDHHKDLIAAFFTATPALLAEVPAKKCSTSNC